MAIAFKEVEQLRMASKKVLGYGYSVVWREVNSRKMRRNRFLERILFESQTDFLRYVGKHQEFSKLAAAAAVDLLRSQAPALEGWLRANPQKLIDAVPHVTGLRSASRRTEESSDRPALFLSQRTLFAHFSSVKLRSRADFARSSDPTSATGAAMTCKRQSSQRWFRRTRGVLESCGILCPSGECCDRKLRTRLRLERLESLIMPTVSPTSFLVASGAAAGMAPLVKVYEGNTGQLVRDIMAYDPEFRGGVNVALWDLDDDNIPDIVTGPGVGGGPHIKAFDGQTGAVLANFMAYDSAFRGGASVAAGLLDGRNAIVTGAGYTGGPHVKVFDTAGDEQHSLMAYDPGFRGGVNVALGDVCGGGHGCIVTAAGKDGGPHIKVFDHGDHHAMSEWMAYDLAFRGGVNVAVLDLNADGYSEVITGAGPGGGPHVRTFDRNGSTMLSFMAGTDTLRSGCRSRPKRCAVVRTGRWTYRRSWPAHRHVDSLIRRRKRRGDHAGRSDDVSRRTGNAVGDSGPRSPWRVCRTVRHRGP